MKTGIEAIKNRYRKATIEYHFGHYFILKNTNKDDGIVAIGKTEQSAIFAAENVILKNPRQYNGLRK